MENEEFCMKNKDFCIKNEEFTFKMMNFAGATAIPGRMTMNPR